MLKELGQIDFVHAHRKYTKNMLKRAQECGILQDKFKIKVLIPEDIIGLKIQASSNDPNRHSHDWADIENLVRLHKGRLNLGLLKEYFALFGREKELDGLLRKIDHA